MITLASLKLLISFVVGTFVPKSVKDFILEYVNKVVDYIKSVLGSSDTPKV